MMKMNERSVLNHGYVALTDVMGTDRTPAQTARTSFRNVKERTPEEDAKLTDYLISHGHNTPIEFNQVRFYMKMPIFVARQLVRHRTASINEVSLRYVKAAREFYIPEPERCQKAPTQNKQGSSNEVVDDPERIRMLIEATGNLAFDAYETLLADGLAPELARMVLPLGTYTEWYWQCDLHNFLHMLKLRLDSHAQYEIRVYAEAMLELVRPIFPTIIESWGKTL
jgi:thymidylate synthase (FAD)